MATRRTQAMEIVARARRIGWEVETASVGNGYKIARPDGKTVQVHLTPSDVNHYKSVIRRLNEAGFEDEERDFLEKRLKAAQEECERLAKEAAAKAEVIARNNKAVHRAAGAYMTEPEEPDFAWALSTEHPAPMMRYMTITPDLAKALMERNSANRPIYKQNVKVFADAIADGHWLFTHQAVAVDKNGVLQDGQHRLQAVIDSDTAGAMPVWVGMEPRNYAVIDTGKFRSNADTLGRITEGNLGQKASVIRLVFMYTNLGHANRGIKIDNATAFEMWESDADRFKYALAWGQRIGRKSSITASAAAAAAYLLFREHGDENPHVIEFLSGLEYKVDERTGDPRGLLHRYLDLKAKRERPPHYGQLTLLIDTWNMVVSDLVVDKRTNLRWTPERKKLPRILSLDKRSATPRFLVPAVTPTVTPAFVQPELKAA